MGTFSKATQLSMADLTFTKFTCNTTADCLTTNDRKLIQSLDETKTDCELEVSHGITVRLPEPDTWVGLQSPWIIASHGIPRHSARMARVKVELLDSCGIYPPSELSLSPA